MLASFLVRPFSKAGGHGEKHARFPGGSNLRAIFFHLGVTMTARESNAITSNLKIDIRKSRLISKKYREILKSLWYYGRITK